MKYAIALIVSLGLTACSWGIKLDAGGTDVRVAWNDDVSHCRVAGAITVSVLDKVGPVGRSRLKVSDELEVMARNQAATLPADTIKPIDQPHGGEQNWNAYVCGSTGAKRAPRSPSAPTGDAVETFPIKDH